MKLFYIFILTLLLACPNKQTSQALKTEKLVGTYHIDNGTRETFKNFFQQTNPENIKLTLNADGTYEIINIPVAIVDIEEYMNNRYWSAKVKGTWKLPVAKYQDSPELFVDFVVINVNDIINDEPQKRSTDYTISVHADKYAISINVGDPGERLKFKFVPD